MCKRRESGVTWRELSSERQRRCSTPTATTETPSTTAKAFELTPVDCAVDCDLRPLGQKEADLSGKPALFVRVWGGSGGGLKSYWCV